MIRALLPLTGLLLLASAAQAQWGLRAAYGPTTLHAQTAPPDLQARVEGRPGYQVGAFYEKPLSPRFALVPELLLSWQQADLQVSDSRARDAGYGADYRLRLLYLHAPVLLRLRLGRAYLEAGPQASVLQASHATGTEVYGGFGGSFPRGLDGPVTDRHRRFDAGLCAGLGLRLPAGYGLNVRATQGLLAVNRGMGYEGRLTNQTLQAALSYQFGPKS